MLITIQKKRRPRHTSDQPVPGYEFHIEWNSDRTAVTTIQVGNLMIELNGTPDLDNLPENVHTGCAKRIAHPPMRRMEVAPNCLVFHNLGQGNPKEKVVVHNLVTGYYAEITVT